MDGFAADSSPYFGPAERTKSQPFAAAWREMVRGYLVPAFRRYQAFLRDEYLAKARESVAVSALPDGRACYGARLREMTTLSITADEVHRTGLEELERIKNEERAIAERLFKTTDLDAAFTQLDQPQYKWENRDEVIAHARKAAERAAGRDAAVVRTAAEDQSHRDADPARRGTDRRRSVPGRARSTGSGRANTRSTRGKWIGNRKSDLEAVVFHETIPGHHLEVSLSRERPDAHLITKIISTAAFSEGWGLYAERLADEMKLYSSDLDLLGMWQSRAYRAARLVVDTGLHAFGWPRQRAIDFMKALHLASDEEIASEVDRYIIWPGQATAYMVGALEIERLRAEAQKRQGNSFDVRRFHDAVLQDGSLPLPMLRAKIESARQP